MAKPQDGKDNPATSVLKPGAVASHELVPRERRQFRALSVANPNYFGNLKASPFPPVLAIHANTTYEEIKCVGSHLPQSNRIDAVIFVKQPFGYGGEELHTRNTRIRPLLPLVRQRCHVVDQGVTNFTAYNVSAGVTGGRASRRCPTAVQPAEEMVHGSQRHSRARDSFVERQVPPSDMPNHVPVWGNVHDTHIQVDPTWFIKWIDVFKLGRHQADGRVRRVDRPRAARGGHSQEGPGLRPITGDYRGKGVEPHRYAMAEIKKLIKTPS